MIFLPSREDNVCVLLRWMIRSLCIFGDNGDYNWKMKLQYQNGEQGGIVIAIVNVMVCDRDRERAILGVNQSNLDRQGAYATLTNTAQLLQLLQLLFPPSAPSESSTTELTFRAHLVLFVALQDVLQNGSHWW